MNINLEKRLKNGQQLAQEKGLQRRRCLVSQQAEGSLRLSFS
uniref:Uncharacterized protein n=1 Tax=Arundo donax TaxID=35708 RepID=A0A0A9BPK0_ARUDO